MNMLQRVAAMSPDTYNQAVRAIVNWCHSNLMVISRQRIANRQLNRPENYEKAWEDQLPPNIDTESGETIDEYIRLQRAEELGFNPGLTLTQRGNCYASIREECMKIVEEKGWTDPKVNKPNDFKEYLAFRISSAKAGTVTEDAVQECKMMLPGIPENRIRMILKLDSMQSGGKLEGEKLDLLAEDGDYETDIDFDEAIHTLKIYQEARLFVAILNSLVAKTERDLDFGIARFRSTFGRDKIATRKIMLQDCFKLRQDYEAFVKQNIKVLELDAAGREIPELSDVNGRILDKIWQDQIEEREIRIEAEKRAIMEQATKMKRVA